MKTETMILIVAIIMILSVGPMSYFFNASTQLKELPGNTSAPTSYSFSDNITGTIIEVQPYIYYVGIASVNNRAIAESIIESIPEIQNYSLDISLNPNGDGYQYGIKVTVNDTKGIKRIGFRLAWRFRSDFEQKAGSIPYTIGKMRLPASFPVSAANGSVIVYSKENQTINTVLTYTKQVGVLTSLLCQNVVTSLNFSITKTPDACIDNDLLVQQQYLGLSAMDILAIPTYHKQMSLEVLSITGVEFSGRYSFASMQSVSMQEIESQTNSTIYLQPDAENTSHGNFTARAPYSSLGTVDYIKSVLKASNFTIEKEYKNAIVALPANVTIEGKTYQFFNMQRNDGQIAINDGTGPYTFNADISILYDEITSVVLKKSSLS